MRKPVRKNGSKKGGYKAWLKARHRVRKGLVK